MRNDVGGLDLVLNDGFTRYLLVDILHGTDRIEREVLVESWSLPGDLGRDPKTTGTLRIVHPSVRGESWTPRGATGLLSPFRASVLLTEVISVGAFERRIQLGLFDVVAVPFAQDVTARIGARWVDVLETIDDELPVDDEFPDDDAFPGELAYASGGLVGGREVVVASIVEVDIESLDGRVLGASFRSPRTAAPSAWEEWRTIGLLPVVEAGADADLPPTTWPADDGSRLDAVQASARALGGVPMVDSAGQWVLVNDHTPTVELVLGEHGTVVDLTSGLNLDGFANVVVGNYEDAAGNPIRAVWTAPGVLSPEAMGREIVAYRKSDQVRDQAAADADVAAVGWLGTSQEVDVEITCVYNPLLELGDHVAVPEAGVFGVVQKLKVSDSPTMVVTARTRRSL